MKHELIRFLQDEQGLTTVEYAIAGGLVASAVVIAFIDLGDAVSVVIDYVAQNLVTFIPAA